MFAERKCRLTGILQELGASVTVDMKLVANPRVKLEPEELMIGNPFLLKFKEELAKLSSKDEKSDEIVLLDNPLAKAELLELRVDDKSLLQIKKEPKEEEEPKSKKQRTN